ncbi:hypothetical protein J5N97_015328 [Dioscorea zingiberensis]|uniref:Uncharacterized protein n=1 Tax=Dioscorea zingiberensis TaxID=325984 RepID=A0A9D5CVI1_9LILI|nr:hypothetical protein J5N97_015328 [Dioscorea zingiberensis]
MPEPTEVFTVDDDHGILMTQRAEERTEGMDNNDPRQGMPSEIKQFLLLFIHVKNVVLKFTRRSLLECLCLYLSALQCAARQIRQKGTLSCN